MNYLNLMWGIYKGACPLVPVLEADKVKRLGAEGAKPKRIRFKALK